MNKFSIAIAGSTKRTNLCAEAILSSKKFIIPWILTPMPKPVGRKQEITHNPLDIFAKKNDIPIIYVEKKINEKTKEEIRIIGEKNNSSLLSKAPDFLLVVDFGYIIPNWLLELPKIAPLNIHPSELPKWRGSSPGQFSILFNDKKSAVTLMKINNKFDQGPIIHQDFFDINEKWNQNDYYSHAFELICQNLGNKIVKFGENNNLATIKLQPEISPTITAKMLNKDLTFIDWEIVKMAMNGKNTDLKTLENKHLKLSSILSLALDHNKSLPLTLERASKAFYSWPNLWTLIPTQKGKKRMKLLETELTTNKNENSQALVLKNIQIEGKDPGSWADFKNILTE